MWIHAKDGSPLSNIFIYKEEYPMVLLSSIAIIRTNENKILPKYLKYYLQNPSIKKYIQTTYTSGSVIPRIILKDFKKGYFHMIFFIDFKKREILLRSSLI